LTPVRTLEFTVSSGAITAKTPGANTPKGDIQLAALEAAAQEVQFGLCHRTFETKYKAVVEVARVVAAIGVD
jgi:hypothetical protein